MTPINRVLGNYLFARLGNSLIGMTNILISQRLLRNALVSFFLVEAQKQGLEVSPQELRLSLTELASDELGLR